MTDLLPALIAAFTARDLRTFHTFRGVVVAAADPDLTRLWVECYALLYMRDDEEAWRAEWNDTIDNAPIIAALDANLARLEGSWTAYLALRAQQQEPVGV